MIIFMILMVFMLSFLTSSNPLDSKVSNILELLNNFCTLIAVYHLLLFSDFTTDQKQKYNFGWSLCLFIMI